MRTGLALPQLGGKQVIQIECSADMGFRAVISGGDKNTGILFAELDVYVPLSQSPVRIESELDVAAHKFAIEGKVIERANVSEGGSLELVLNDKTRLVFPPHEKFESWELRWKDGLQVIALPGGGWDSFG